MINVHKPDNDTLEKLVNLYIDEHYEKNAVESNAPSDSGGVHALDVVAGVMQSIFSGNPFKGVIRSQRTQGEVDGITRQLFRRESGKDPDDVDFTKLQTSTVGETFSEMLTRLVAESGEKNSVIYTRANIDRRHFSKIINHDDYKPSKMTVLAFAIALKLDFERTKELLATAGFTLSNANMLDVIVSFFIEYKIFDVDEVNQILYKYNQPLLGG